jgi:hypothetical protein
MQLWSRGGRMRSSGGLGAAGDGGQAELEMQLRRRRGDARQWLWSDGAAAKLYSCRWALTLGHQAVSPPLSPPPLSSAPSHEAAKSIPATATEHAKTKRTSAPPQFHALARENGSIPPRLRIASAPPPPPRRPWSLRGRLRAWARREPAASRWSERRRALFFQGSDERLFALFQKIFIRKVILRSKRPLFEMSFASF